jgi:hypothetical protein
VTLFPLTFSATFLVHWPGTGETKVGIFASLAVGPTPGDATLLRCHCTLSLDG